MSAIAQVIPTASRWRTASALFVAVLLWLLVWYWPTGESMVAIWIRSETFTHGFLIAPISAWLIWQRRRELQAITPRPAPIALVFLALAGAGWLVSNIAGVTVTQQYMFVLMIPLLAWALFGHRVAREIAFAGFFLLFSVPFGEFLTPPLIDYTADFTILALRLTGIPVYREGNFFMIPSGNWSVVEACSGLRYLIASVTLGVIYAYLTYRSLKRRLLFILASAIVPIVANGFRAYMIVMIGHLSEMRYAVGVDHLIYGWVFFGIVMLALFWAGAFWREDLVEGPPAARRGVNDDRPGPGAGLPIVALSAALVLAVWPVAADTLFGVRATAAPQFERIPPAEGWAESPLQVPYWKPWFPNARASHDQGYQGDGRQIGLHVAFFRNQRGEQQMVSTQNVLVGSLNSAWHATDEFERTLPADAGVSSAIETHLRSHAFRILAWRWYWVDGRLVSSPVEAKLRQAWQLLSGRGDDGAIIVVYSPHDLQQAAAERTLAAFMGAHRDRIAAEVARASAASLRP